MKYDIHSLVNSADFGAVAGTTVRCKFVLVVNMDATVLVLGPLSRYTYHADIVEAYCATQGLKTKRVGKGDVVEILDTNTTIAGGGYLTWSKSAQSLKLGGASKAYGHFDLEIVQAVLAETQMFSGHRISIEM